MSPSPHRDAFPNAPLLEATGLEAGYQGKRVVNGVNLCISKGEIVALLGPNGAGKSTLLKALFGLLDRPSGSVRVLGAELRPRSPAASLKAGFAWMPQGGRVFRHLSVDDNLRLAADAIKDNAIETLGEWKQRFPILAERARIHAGRLSGGERQLLCLAQSMMTRPRLLLADEPSIGLSPQNVATTLSTIRELRDEFGTAVLVVEQNVKAALSIADRVVVLRLGRIVLDLPQGDASKDRLREAFLGASLIR